MFETYVLLGIIQNVLFVVGVIVFAGVIFIFTGVSTLESGSYYNGLNHMI